jgi:hypothetical protein
MKFAIRDDDISYFTIPRNLNKIYKGIWETIPISFAVIPFLHGSVHFTPDKYKKDKKYPVGENKALVRFLKEKIRQGKASILLHGYSHRWKKEGHEFDIDNNLFEKVKEGKEYLTNVFDTKVTCFVAPNHAFSKKGMKAVIENKLNIVGSPAVRHRPLFFSWGHISNMAKLTLFRIYHIPGIKYPYPLNFHTHRELYCYSLTPFNYEDLKRGFEFSRKKDGVFCVATHSNTISHKGLSNLRNLVKKSMEAEADYVTVDSAL